METVHMAVRAISEREAGPRLKLLPPDDVGPEPADVPAPKTKPPRPVRQVIYPTEQIMAVLAVLTRVVATRIILMLAGIGAFVLALTAVHSGTIQSIVASAIYDLTVFAPCIYLSLRRE
jgi:hypothetical protein